MSPATPERIAAWLERVLPFGVRAEFTRLDDEGDPSADLDDLWPSERAAVGSAVDVRRREFVAGRRCARLALARFGSDAAPIPVGPNREPQWPEGFVGSITHSRQLVGAVVAPAASGRSLGLDVEPVGAVTPALFDQLLTASERDLAERGTIPDLATTVFCAKEAVYKATFPLSGRWLGYLDATVEVDDGAGAFVARIDRSVDHPMAGTALPGFLTRDLGHVAVALAIGAS